MSNNLTKNGTAEKDQEFFQSKQLQLSKYTKLGMALVKQDQVSKQLQLSQNTEELQLRMTVVMMMKLFLNHPILLISLIESQELFMILFPLLFPILFQMLFPILVSILLSEQKRVRMKVPLILLVLLLHFSE